MPTDIDAYVIDEICGAQRPGSETDRTALMCRHVKRVIIENFNYCNRQCNFCPNSIVDRRSEMILLPEDVFDKVLMELSSGRFANSLMFGRYHEPFAHPVVFDRIRAARRALPDAKIVANTNGDFLSPDSFAEIAESGLNDLRIMAYLPNGTRYSTQTAFEFCDRIIRRLDLKASLQTHIECKTVVFRIEEMGFQRLGVSLHCENYACSGFGADRGGSIPQLSLERRQHPCFAPFFEINIDFDGSVMPCCNLVSSVPSHREYVMGNVAKQSITDVFFGRSWAEFREQVARPNPTPPPCKNCQYYWPNRLHTDEMTVYQQ